LSRDEIRVQYSGFIIFAAQILSVGTGLVFTLLLTRNMTKQEFGVWSNIFDLVAYFTLASGLFPFWTMRFVARRKDGAVRTGLLANLIVSLVSVALYLPLISLITSSFNIAGAYVIMYLVASAQIINVYLIGMLENCTRAVKPQALGYGLLLEEASKVALAYVLVVGLHQLFLGAMISLIVAASIQAFYYSRLLREELKQRIQWNYMREWLKGSAASFYNAAGNQMAAFVFVLLFVYGGQAARGDYQAAATFANMIGYSSSLAFALYPKLLVKNSLEDVTSTFKTVLMFAVPMATIAMIMSQSLLTILNSSYIVASPVLVLLTLDALVLMLSQFYSSVFLGAERLDEEAKIPLSRLVRSKIFKLFTLPYLQAAIALPMTYYALTQLAATQSVQAVVYVTIINMTAHIAAFAVLCVIMRKDVRIVVPWKDVGKYVSASAVSAVVLFLLPRPTTILLTLGTVAVGAMTYAVLLLAIDREARKLALLVWREIRLNLAPEATR
jgi:O-antigen/teichoic acid export membrane protein